MKKMIFAALALGAFLETGAIETIDVQETNQVVVAELRCEIEPPLYILKMNCGAVRIGPDREGCIKSIRASIYVEGGNEIRIEEGSLAELLVPLTLEPNSKINGRTALNRLVIDTDKSIDELRADTIKALDCEVVAAIF